MKQLLALTAAGLFLAGSVVLPVYAADKPAAPPAKTEAPAPAKTEKMEKKAGDAPAHMVDINSATLDELKALPAIGDAYAKAIVDHRPYKRKSDLVKMKVVPQATYDAVKNQITAKQHTAKQK